MNVLCFFTANDVILSHMITFLNDKEDKQLRASFFKCIIGVTAYVGWHASPILTPLLQQVMALFMQYLSVHVQVFVTLTAFYTARAQ